MAPFSCHSGPPAATIVPGILLRTIQCELPRDRRQGGNVRRMSPAARHV